VLVFPSRKKVAKHRKNVRSQNQLNPTTTTSIMQGEINYQQAYASA